MTEPVAIVIPLINPNEPGAKLAALHISTGQQVSRGDALCTLETTKSTLELSAERDGFIVGLAHNPGDTIQAGEILAYLADSPDWQPPAPSTGEVEIRLPSRSDLHMSRAAISLANEHHLNLDQFSTNTFITEKMVRELIEQASQPILKLQVEHYDPRDIIIYGGGGHGKSLIDLICTLGSFTIAGIVDDSLKAGSAVMGIPVLGGAGILPELIKRGLHLAANAVGGIGNIDSRIAVFERLAQAGFTCPILVHPTAWVEPSAILAEGVQVFPHAYVGSEAHVGFGVIVNTGAIVSHDCTLGDYVNLSPGAILAGEVHVGDSTLIGMGVTVNLRVSIGARARIGNGATVKQDVPAGSIVHAGAVWPE